MRRAWTMAAIALLAAAAAVLALSLGPSDVGAADVLRTLRGEADDVAREVILRDRLPGVFLGLLVGAALALGGVLLQALLRNDLAEPYLVGVGPGALLGVTVAAFLAARGLALPGVGLRGPSALLGAVGVSLLVFGLARRSRRGGGPTLLLVGVAIGAFVSAVATALLYVALPDWHRVVYWLLGHLSPRSASELWGLLAVVVLAGAYAWTRSRDLDALALGEEGAWLIGVDVRRALPVLGLTAALVAAAAVAVSGLIGFVGLLVPHLARRLVGPNHCLLIPGAMGLGAALLVLADAVARTAHPPLQLPVGVVTAALGAPCLVWILLRGR